MAGGLDAEFDAALDRVAHALSKDSETFQVLRRRDRDRSTVAAVEFDTTAGVSRSAWVKIRHERGLAPTVHSQERPRLTPLPDGSAEGARLEYLGLRHIERAVAQSGLDWMHAVEPIACIPEEATVVMELVAQGTVKHRLWRLGPTAHGDRTRQVVATMAHRVGRWLREYQAAPWEGELRPGRTATPEHALAKVSDMCRYLRAQGVNEALLDAVFGRARDAAAESIEPWALVPCHGDFSPRNILYRDPGDLWVIDPMPRWSVPPWEDLARFRLEAQMLIESRYPGALGGSALGAILRRELELGYLGEDRKCRPHADLVEALVLLDGWCALAARRASTRAETGTRVAIKNRMIANVLNRVCRDWLRELSSRRRAS